MEKQTTNLNHLVYNYYSVKSELNRITELYNSRLSDLREGLVEEAYEALLRDARGAGRSRELVDDDAAQQVLNDLLCGETFERLLKSFNPEQDLIAFIKGFLRRDYRNGLPKAKSEVAKRLELERPYLVDEDGDSLVEKLGFGAPQEDDGDPLEQLCRKTEADRNPLNNLTDEEIRDRLEEEVVAHAQCWAAEDETDPEARRAREIVYTQAMLGILDILKMGKAGKGAFTPGGRLRLDSACRRRCAELSGRSDRMVRTYLRSLEPRLEGLRG